MQAGVPPRFQVLEALRHSAAGSIFRATDRQTGAEVALEVAGPASLPMARERFRLQALVLAGLRHPGVVRLLASGEEGGRPWLAWEFVPGGTLRDRLGRGPLEPEEAARTFAALFEALAWLHDRGLVHRALAPEHVLLDGAGFPRLSGLGLLRDQRAPSRLTLPGTILGEAAYLAPEQALSHEVGPSADLYSAGVCLFEGLTGRLPFASADPLALIHGHMALAPPAPRSLRPDLPEGLEAVVLRLLEKNPAARFPTAASAARALRGLVGAADPAGRLAVEAETSGREEDRDRLLQALPGNRWLVTGPRGSGRSHLLRSLAAREPRALLLAPKGPPLAALEALLERLRTPPERLGEWLRAGGPARAAEEVARLLEGHLLLVDDADRLDATTRQVAEALLAIPPAPSAGWASALTALHESCVPTPPGVHRMHLAPMEVAEVAERAAGRPLEPEEVRWVQQRSGGRPRAARLLGGALAGGRPRDLPTSLPEVVAGGVQRASAEERRLLGAMARRDPSPAEDLARALGLSPPEVQDLVHRLERRGLVEDGPGGPRLAGSLVRRAVGGEPPPSPTEEERARQAFALLDRGAVASAGEVAEGGEDAALRVARAEVEGDPAALSSLQGEGLAPALKARLALRLAEARLERGDRAAAALALEEAETLGATGPRRAALAALLAREELPSLREAIRLEMERGREDSARSLIASGLERWPEEPQLLALLAGSLALEGRPAEAKDWYGRCLDAARARGDHLHEILALVGLALAWWRLGALPRALERLGEAAGLARAADRPTTLLQVLPYLVRFQVEAGHQPAAAASALDLLEVAVRADDSEGRETALAWLQQVCREVPPERARHWMAKAMDLMGAPEDAAPPPPGGLRVVRAPGFPEGTMLPAPGPVRLGRGEDCEILLAVPSVSRLHARLDWSGSEPVLTHCAVRNHTLVNGETLTGSRILRPGDLVQLADQVLLRWEGAP